MIIDETVELLVTKHRELTETTIISRVNIGLYFTAVQLSSGYCGVASIDQTVLSCCNKKREKEFGAFTPGKIHGQKLLDLFSLKTEPGILNFVKLAAINAVSAEIITKSNYRVIEDKDPIDLIDLDSSKTVCVVGAFHSYLKNIAGTSANLIVLEIDKNSIPPEFQKHFIAAEKASLVFPQSDVIIITGSTLVNNTLDNILKLIPPKKQVIIVGPTAGLIPDVLFKYGISIIGSTRVIDADQIFSAVAEGAAGYHLFHNGAQKICILNDTE